MTSSSQRGSIFTPFLVAVALAMLTFGMVAARDHGLSARMFLLVLFVGIVVQLFLVGVFSMHLRWEGKLIGFLLVPVTLLALVLILCLLPDTLFAAWYDLNDQWLYSAQTTEALSP
jgi:hypothetical protein